MLPLQNRANIVHKPKLFLAFTWDANKYAPTFTAQLSRLLHGPFGHVEIVFTIGQTMHRAIVPRPDAAHPDGLVFRDLIDLGRTQEWYCLQLPCDAWQIAQVSNALDVIIERGDYFSERVMWKSGIPRRLHWIANCWLDKDDQRARGEPTYCGRMCVQALQAAGLLRHIHADAITASDLYTLAIRQLDATPVVLDKSVKELDSLGLRRNWMHVNYDVV